MSHDKALLALVERAERLAISTAGQAFPIPDSPDYDSYYLKISAAGFTVAAALRALATSEAE